MVNIRDRFFLVYGSNFLQRQKIIENFKCKILKEKSASINILTFYGKEVKLKDFQEKILTSSFDNIKILIFKDFSEIPQPVRLYLLNNLDKLLISNYIIFESDKESHSLQGNKKIASDKFFSLVFKNSQVYRVSSSKRKLSIEDFMGALRKNDLDSCLYVLENLFEGTAKDKAIAPLIIGILVRKFSYPNINSFNKEKCFEYLWKADRAIKEKGHDARLTIETLLIKLLTISSNNDN